MNAQQARQLALSNSKIKRDEVYQEIIKLVKKLLIMVILK